MLLRSNTFVVVGAMMLELELTPPFGGPRIVRWLALDLSFMAGNGGGGPHTVSRHTDFRRCDVRVPRLASTGGGVDAVVVGAATKASQAAAGDISVLATTFVSGAIRFFCGGGTEADVVDGTEADAGGAGSTDFLSLFAFGSVDSSLSFSSTY